MLDVKKAFNAKMDASLIGVGVVLLQNEENGRVVIVYASKKFPEAEMRYSVIGPIVFALLLIAGDISYWETKFLLQTDHKPLPGSRARKIAEASWGDGR
jgi:hypothetical protein